MIQTLAPSAYGGFLESVGDGDDAVTHKALVKFHDTDSAVDSYVKVYCVRAAPKGLVNELIGFSLARSGGLLTPPRAAILLLDDEQAAFLPKDMELLRTVDDHVVSWCVQSLAGKTPKQSFNLAADKSHALRSMQQDFKKWKELPDVATLDAWLLNEDRNLGNVIRVSEGRYAVIDHGRVCTGNSWVTPLEKARMKHCNKLALAAWDDADLDRAPSSFHLHLVNSFDRHRQALQDAASELDYWLSLLVSPAEEKDASAFMDNRVNSVRDYLKSAFGLLLP
ncbi:hypothetical protein [Luteimonas mephitis]|uniref:hypothetical protein n=1 Tax=Luteimonas mephitis TaxID=83615 RepID=UPI003A95A3C4